MIYLNDEMARICGITGVRRVGFAEHGFYFDAKDVAPLAGDITDERPDVRPGRCDLEYRRSCRKLASRNWSSLRSFFEKAGCTAQSVGVRGKPFAKKLIVVSRGDETWLYFFEPEWALMGGVPVEEFVLLPFDDALTLSGLAGAKLTLTKDSWRALMRGQG